MIVFFNQQINNALFRHQTLIWLSESGVDLRLYGRGWEKHPRLARHARGVADNITELGLIYRASKINIQVTPHGAVHQRLLDGLVAGAFFLLRWHPGDAVGPLFEQLWDWCRENHIQSDTELFQRADGPIRQLIERINQLEGSPQERREMSVFDVMNGHRDSDFMTGAASIWPEYDQVAFNTRGELEKKLHYFLGEAAERQRIAEAMRRAVVDRVSYVSITRRLLKFMADDMAAAPAG